MYLSGAANNMLTRSDIPLTKCVSAVRTPLCRTCMTSPAAACVWKGRLTGLCSSASSLRSEPVRRFTFFFFVLALPPFVTCTSRHHPRPLASPGHTIPSVHFRLQGVPHRSGTASSLLCIRCASLPPCSLHKGVFTSVSRFTIHRHQR